ncbi:unnamed protein product, partial [Meganyctiphanes norvegica]|uniref:Ankyrin repeat protein n=1 Tax=Meganyctiphanes norvegica TaxID=48144 RepID=A0AAV2S2M4_MEGNR
MGKLTAVCIVVLLGSVISDGDLDLWDAAKNGNLSDVYQALAAEANPNWRNLDYYEDEEKKWVKRKWTSLHVASRYNHPSVVSALIDAGANTELEDRSDFTPIFVASEYGSKDAVTKLIECGVDPNVKVPATGRTPLHIAASYNQPLSISALLDEGADINIQDDWLYTPINLASESGSTEAVNILLRRGADIHIVRDLANYSIISGASPLMSAAYQGHVSTVEALVDAHANVNQVSGNGMTALHYAAGKNQDTKNRTDIALLLLQKGAYPRQQDNEGMTPADVARYMGNKDLANIIDNFTGATAPLTPPNTGLTVQLTKFTTTNYDFYLLGFGVLVLITETLFSVLF